MADLAAINKKKPVVLISMDGIGVAPPSPGNAVSESETLNLDKYWPTSPHGMLEASGLYVGLPEGTDGNSEVGHMTMGSGKIVLQDLPRINNAVMNESFFENPMIKGAFEHARKNKSKVHVMGLVGNGSVHADINHLFSLIEFCKREKFPADKFLIHAFTDGRDSSVSAAYELFEQIEAKCIQKKCGRIVSMVGRAYAMDRNKNWERTKKAYEMLALGKAKIAKDWKKALKDSYANKIFDEYIEPTMFTNKISDTIISENDSVIFFNFRPDRAQQLARAFEDESFPGWQRQIINNLVFVGFTDYQGGFPKNMAFPPETITMPLGKVISDSGMTQLRIAESEKFAHVTYFFNGGNGAVFPGEKWVKVPSPTTVATFDLLPEMSQVPMTELAIQNILSGEYDFVLINYAGPDMVAHTGVIPATIKAIESCDKCIGQIIDTALSMDGAVIISADHGNAEEMIDLQTGEPDTKHSINQVPLLIIKNGLPPIELPMGTLGDIAPTVLGLLNIPVPPEMTGRDLLK